MPTLILLDNSLSMCKNGSIFGLEMGQKVLNIRDLSHILVKDLISSIQKYDEYEFVALVSQFYNSMVLPLM